MATILSRASQRAIEGKNGMPTIDFGNDFSDSDLGNVENTFTSDQYDNNLAADSSSAAGESCPGPRSTFKLGMTEDKNKEWCTNTHGPISRSTLMTTRTMSVPGTMRVGWRFAYSFSAARKLPLNRP
ncbi:hypothetical protein BDV96DRAFT_602219 [Lophiotrema nucula]|uniref:Uncharacterized protein n=1 Tax=Lophiotrema nucula TaxID=690887 RepID=A0A6A5YZN3_9PLEO|nr:hypothetical protein BDV96DRAFT_602219 [Lophiotrema nucula]